MSTPHEIDTMENFSPKRKITFFSILLVGVIIPFVLFDALQQQYFMEAFGLWPNGEPYSVFILIKAHLIRWSVWAAGGSLLVIFALKNSYNVKSFSWKQLVIYLASISAIITLDISSITLIYLLSEGAIALNATMFAESFEYFFYQKAPVFFISYVGLLTVTHFYKEREQLTIQIIELKELKKSNQFVYNELKSRSLDDSEKIISVKIGNRIRQVLVSGIEWIESDNYCVKLHTGEGSFTIRASMKYFEKYLPPEKFIRVHRNAIVNRDLIEELDLTDSPIVKLRTGEVIKVALSRLGEVRKRIRSEVA